MKHILKFSYYIKDELTEEIESITDEFKSIIKEGKLGDWMFVAPKIRKLQEKANQLRIRAARAEARQKQEIDRAVEMGKKPDTGRMWELLQKKKDAWEEMAREFELEAQELGSGNDYLRRVQRAARLEGNIKVNKEKIAVAESEERRELNKANREMQRIIRAEEKIIRDKMEADKATLKVAELKDKEIEKAEDKVKKEANPVTMYFKGNSAERLRQERNK